MLTAEETDDRIKNGLAMSDLRRAAVKMGYQSVVGKTTFAKLGEMKVPAIVGIQPGGHKHFVVLKGTFGDHVYFADPIRGNIRMPNWEFVEQWQKKAILVVHKPGEKVKKYSAAEPHRSRHLPHATQRPDHPLAGSPGSRRTASSCRHS